MSKKNFLAVGIVIIVSVVIFVFVLNKNNGKNNPSNVSVETSDNNSPIVPEETSVLETLTFNSDISDWKTYINEKYGFELKYPNEYGSSGDYSIWTLSDEGNILSEWGVNYGQETVFAVDVYLKSEKENLANNFGNEVESDKKLLVNDIIIKRLDGGKTVWNVFEAENENYIYIMISSFSSLNDKQRYDEFQAILSTFKFF